MKNIEDVPLCNGEYDLVNISLIGHDPITGRSFETCQDEHAEALGRVIELGETLKWYQLWKRFKLARKLQILEQRLGMPLAWNYGRK